MNKNEERNEAGFNWPVVIRNPNARASLDYYYGPYDSVDSMKSSVPNELWVPGFTAAVQSADGAVEEWWVQGEGAKADFVKKNALPPGVFRLMGRKGSFDEVKAETSPLAGDVWLVDGEGGSYDEYIWTGEDWEKLGPAIAESSTLTIKLPGGVTREYDGSSAVTVTLSDFITKTELNSVRDELRDEAASKYATKTEVKALPTWQSGDIAIMGRDTKTGNVKYRVASTWGETGLRLNVSGEAGLRRNNGSFYRLNPLVLAVRISDLNYSHSYTIRQFYNPFGLDVSIERLNNGVFKLTHNLSKAGISPWNSGVASDDSQTTYLVVGNACVGRYNDREHGLFSVVQRYPDAFDFRTVRGGSSYDFNTLDILIFDFKTL